MDYNLFFTTFLMVILTISGISKLLNLSSFKETLFEIGFSKKLSTILIYIVPSVELLIVILLIFKQTQYVGLFSTLILCLAFICVTLYSLKSSKKIKCNCFGSLTEEKLGVNTFAHITLLIIPVLYILFSKESKYILSYSFSEIGYATLLNMGLVMVYILISSMKNFRDAIKINSF